MEDFKKVIRNLNMDDFKAGDLTPDEERGPHDAVQAQFFGCAGCARCFRCFGCFGCVGCFACARCFRCAGCGRCGGCF
nr:heterocycloanthracin/sonorensin family bacteriocin [Alicyclobacillus contaminans]